MQMHGRTHTTTKDLVAEAALICREFAGSGFATPAEREEHLRAARALDGLKGRERRERAAGLRRMLVD